MTQDQFIAALKKERDGRDLNLNDMAFMAEVPPSYMRRYFEGIVFPPAHEAMIRFIQQAPKPIRKKK